MKKITKGLVKDYYWRCEMHNGAKFEIRTAEDLSRDEARVLLLKKANGNEDIFSSVDIKSMWVAVK